MNYEQSERGRYVIHTLYFKHLPIVDVYHDQVDGSIFVRTFQLPFGTYQTFESVDDAKVWVEVQFGNLLQQVEKPQDEYTRTQEEILNAIRVVADYAAERISAGDEQQALYMVNDLTVLVGALEKGNLPSDDSALKWLRGQDSYFEDDYFVL